MLNNAKDILNQAADYLEAFGWVQETLIDKQGRACLIGSIEKVAGILDKDYNRTDAGELVKAYQYLYDQLGHYYPADWNDEPGRTAGEVIDLLRKAAADAASSN